MSKNPKIKITDKLLYEGLYGVDEQITLQKNSARNFGFQGLLPESCDPLYLNDWAKEYRMRFGIATGSFGRADILYENLKSEKSLQGFWDGLHLEDSVKGEIIQINDFNEDHSVFVQVDHCISDKEYQKGYTAGITFLAGLVNVQRDVDFKDVANGNGYDTLLSLLDIPLFDVETEQLKKAECKIKKDSFFHTTAQILSMKLNNTGIEKIIQFLQKDEKLRESDKKKYPAQLYVLKNDNGTLVITLENENEKEYVFSLAYTEGEKQKAYLFSPAGKCMSTYQNDRSQIDSHTLDNLLLEQLDIILYPKKDTCVFTQLLSEKIISFLKNAYSFISNEVIRKKYGSIVPAIDTLYGLTTEEDTKEKEMTEEMVKLPIQKTVSHPYGVSVFDGLIPHLSIPFTTKKRIFISEIEYDGAK